MKCLLQPRKQQFSNPGVLNITVPIVKMWKLTYAVQYFNIFEMYNSISGKTVYINGTGHMTKMSAMLIYGKNLKTSSPTKINSPTSISFFKKASRV